MAFKEIRLHEQPAYKTKQGSQSPPSLQFSTPINVPPPHDRQYFQLGQRDCLADFEARRAWDPPEGYNGPPPARLALEVIAQGASIKIQEQLTDAQVAEINAAWLAWAKKG